MLFKDMKAFLGRPQPTGSYVRINGEWDPQPPKHGVHTVCLALSGLLRNQQGCSESGQQVSRKGGESHQERASSQLAVPLIYHHLLPRFSV